MKMGGTNGVETRSTTNEPAGNGPDRTLHKFSTITAQVSQAAVSRSRTGAFCFNKRMNSRIQAGWSGQARAETITPSTTASELTNSAPAALISGSNSGYAAVRLPFNTPG